MLRRVITFCCQNFVHNELFCLLYGRIQCPFGTKAALICLPSVRPIHPFAQFFLCQSLKLGIQLLHGKSGFHFIRTFSEYLGVCLVLVRHPFPDTSLGRPYLVFSLCMSRSRPHRRTTVCRCRASDIRHRPTKARFRCILLLLIFMELLRVSRRCLR